MEIRMKGEGLTEPDIHRFEGATADCVWNAFAEMAEPDMLARLEEYEDMEGRE